MMKGSLSFFVPSLRDIHSTGGSTSSRYCYSVFLRHMALLRQHGLLEMPKVVAELGPGDSIGVGLAALVAGAESYYGFDVVSYSIPEREQKIFEELCILFQNKESIPDDEEFPFVHPKLSSYDFPKDLFTEEDFGKVLFESRLNDIRSSLRQKNEKDSLISYKVPWDQAAVLQEESVDWIFSQAVLEHVEDLEKVYMSMYRWLKPGGFMSHQIDFKCHGMSPFWNGHWAFSPLVWKIIKGRASYLLNRHVYDVHVDLMKKAGFSIVYELPVLRKDGLPTESLSKEYKQFSKRTLETAGAFVIARKV